MCLLAFPPVRLRAGRHTGRRADRCKDLHICGYACTEIGRLADLSACKVKGIFPYPYRFGVWWQLLAASGREWLRSYHVFKGLNALPLHPSGRAKPKARTYPQSVCYGFLCPLRHSKVCFELPETLRVTPASLAPERGRGFLSEVGKPVFLPAVCMPEAALMA